MSCKIDHSNPEAIPAIMCRLCGTPWDLLTPAVDLLVPTVSAIAPAGEVRPVGIAQGAWEAQQAWKVSQRETDKPTKEEVRAYHDQKRLAELEQWRMENPDLYRMERKSKRDKEKRIAKRGIKATGKIHRKRG